jgi:hypothetical protein
MKLSLIALLLLPTLAHADFDEGTRGGGVGIVCDGDSRVYLADTFVQARAGKLDSIQQADPTEIIAAAVRYFEQARPAKDFPHPYLAGQQVSLGWLIAHAHLALAFELRESVETLHDDHLDVTAPGCHKIQVAVQEFNSNRVALADPLVTHMSHGERGLLELHETLLSLRRKPGADTTPVRNFVAAILDDPRFEFTQIVQQVVQASTPPTTYLPTLSAPPTKLNCHVTATNRNDFGWAPGSSFSLTKDDGGFRTEGLTFPAGSALPPELTATLDVEPLSRSILARSVADFRLTWTSVQADKKSLGVILTDLEPASCEFGGDLQWVQLPASGQSWDDALASYSSYRVVCDGVPAALCR